MAGETSDAFFSALEQDIPWLNIEGIKFNSGDLIPRFEAEYQSGNTTIDMVWTSSLSVLSGKGWIVDLSEELPAWSNLPEGSRGQYNVPLRASAHGLLYNTDLMSESEVPPDRASLTDPQYEGKIVIGQTWSHVLPVFKAVEEANPGWMEAMAEQDILWSTHLGTAIKACAAGQRAMNVPSLPKYQFIEGRAKDTPAKIATQMNPLYMFVYPAGVNKKAPHRNGAMYLANYMATEDGQARLKEAVKTDCAGTSQESLYCDPEAFNDIVKEYDEVEFLSFLTPDEFDTWSEKAQQTFGL
jgi:ABC-type Fe3+ transport system substrate-binding protein